MMTENEIWKDVVGYEGYYIVSNIGVIKSVGRIVNSKNGYEKYSPSKILSQEKTSNGYMRVMLSKKGEKKRHSVHRIVALAFIKNPFKKQYVDHINTIKHDNRVCNLRWATPTENNLNPITSMRNSVRQIGIPKSEITKQKISQTLIGFKHSDCTKRKLSEIRRGKTRTDSRAVNQYTKYGVFVQSYKMLSDASNVASVSHIYCVCQGSRKTAGGFVWKWKEACHE